MAVVVRSLALGILAAVAFGCSASTPAATDSVEDPLTGSPIVARGMFTSEADRVRFETDVLPSARAFLAFWAEAGLHVSHGKARLFISPPRGTLASQSLPAIYGSSVFDDLRGLETSIRSAESSRAAFALADEFTCERPPLHRSFLEGLEKHLDDPAVTTSVIADALRRSNDALMTTDATFSFRSDNGEFELPARRNCSYVLLGHATEPTRAHPFLEKDVVNHELAHALHYGAWMASGPFGDRLSASVNEAVGDILAHVFDGDACHGKVLDAQGAVVGCRRTMTGYELSVSDAVWKLGRGDHGTGQALRDFVWSIRSDPSIEPRALKLAIRAGIDAVPVALNGVDREPLANVPVFDDEILSIRYRFAREYDATSAFFDAVCARLGDPAPRACGEKAARIGDPRTAMRERWLANAPTAIGAAGVTLADGRRVVFEVDGALVKKMTVTSSTGEEHAYAGSPEIDRDANTGDVTLWFSSVGWTSNGELRTR